MSSRSRPLSYPTTPLTLFWYPVPDTGSRYDQYDTVQYYIASPLCMPGHGQLQSNSAD